MSNPFTVHSIRDARKIMELLYYERIYKQWRSKEESIIPVTHEDQKDAKNLIPQLKIGDFVWIPSRLILLYVTSEFACDPKLLLKNIPINEYPQQRFSNHPRIDLRKLYTDVSLRGLTSYTSLFRILAEDMMVSSDEKLYIFIKDYYDDVFFCYSKENGVDSTSI
jgi:hypothetical protein